MRPFSKVSGAHWHIAATSYGETETSCDQFVSKEATMRLGTLRRFAVGDSNVSLAWFETAVISPSARGLKITLDGRTTTYSAKHCEGCNSADRS